MTGGTDCDSGQGTALVGGLAGKITINFQKGMIAIYRGKQNSGNSGQESFRKELEKSMIDIGIKSKTQLARIVGISERTLQRRFENIGEMKVSELRSLLEVLPVDTAQLTRLLCPNKNNDIIL